MNPTYVLAAVILATCVLAACVGFSFLLGTPKRRLGIRLVWISGSIFLATAVGLLVLLTQR